VPRRRLHDLEPDDARLDAGDPRRRVDRHAAHPARPEQDRVLERTDSGNTTAAGR
jgi:hypothetical protein